MLILDQSCIQKISASRPGSPASIPVSSFPILYTRIAQKIRNWGCDVQRLRCDGHPAFADRSLSPCLGASETRNLSANVYLKVRILTALVSLDRTTAAQPQRFS